MTVCPYQPQAAIDCLNGLATDSVSVVILSMLLLTVWIIGVYAVYIVLAWKGL